MKHSTIEYEVYEDNGGGVHFALVSGNECVYLATHMELMLNYKDGRGEVARMIAALDDDPSAWETWEESYDGDDIGSIYDSCCVYPYLIAWGTVGDPSDHEEIDVDHMGYNARDLLGHNNRCEEA